MLVLIGQNGACDILYKSSKWVGDVVPGLMGQQAGLGGVSAHFLVRVSIEWLRPVRLSLIFVVRMIYKYFPSVSPKGNVSCQGKALSEVRP